MKITAVHVRNWKRLREVDLKLDSDRYIVLVGGKNGQGKSSLLEALTAAFAGKSALPAEPVRKGEEAAEIRVELDGGAVTIRRVVKPSGDSVLEVRADGVKERSPQAVIDRLMGGARFIDPFDILEQAPAQLRATILGLVGDADQLADLEREKVRAFDRRTEVGRDLKKAQGELARLPEPKPDEPVDIGALSTEARAMDEKLRAQQAAVSKFKAAERETAQLAAALDTARDQLEAMKRKVEKLTNDHAGAVIATLEAEKETVAANDAAGNAAVRRDEIDAELRRAGEHNDKVARDRAAIARRAAVQDEVQALTAQHAELDGQLAGIAEKKAAILAAAPLPVPGLGVDDKGVTLNGLPLDQAARSEQLRVALGLAIALSPGLQDVWMRDAALLDDESMALVAQMAEATGHRVWLERVGDKDPGAIVIHDGGVLEAKPS